MSSWLEALLEFLLKYPTRVFETGKLVWQGAGSATTIVPLTILVGGIALFTYRHRVGRARIGDRIVLAALRASVFGLLALCLLRPGLLVSTSVPQQNVLGVVLDDSKSMLIRDADSATRLAVAQRLFDSSGAIVRRLSERFAIRYYRFSETVNRIDGAAELRGAGPRTDIGTALAETRRDFVGTPLAGLILVTDGADNGGGPLGDALLSLKAAKIPVYPVGVGSERFARDAAVDRFEVPRSTLRGAVLLGTVAIRARGLAGERLSLVVEDGGRIVATREVEVPRGAEMITVPIRIPPLEPGTRPLKVVAKPLAGEAVSQNNTFEAQVRVRDRREKILYIEGAPRPEFAFLRRAAAADSNLQVVGLQQTSRGKFLRLGVDDSLELIAGFPTSRSELYRYRGLVLGSIDASSFTADQLRMIAEFVGERGGGLLALGGRGAFGEGGFEGTALAEVLPVTFGNRRADSGEAAVELKIKPTPAGFGNAALMLTATEAANPPRWDSLPPLTTVNRVSGIKAGATELLAGSPTQGGSRQPALAFHRYGRGKAIAFAVQDSWLWQMHASIAVEDQTHETLWRQLLRWLLEDVPDRLELATTPAHPAPGQRVTLRADLADSGFARVNDGELIARVTGVDGATTDLGLEWTLGADGTYTGSFVPTQEGVHRIELEARHGGDTLRLEPEMVTVADRGADFVNAEMRAPLLERIAQETGGRFYTTATASRLPDDVIYTESGVTVTETKDLWDMPIVFFVLAALLGTEWVYRRRKGLV